MKQSYQKLGKQIWHIFWPFFLFLAYILAQLLMFKYIWASLIITILVAIPLIKYQKVKPRKFTNKWLTKLLIVLVALILLLLTLNFYELVLQHFHIQVGTSQNQQILKNMAKQKLLITGIDTIIMAPVFEEGVFRMGLISFKNKYWLIISSIVSTIIFAACHIAGSINIFVLLTYMVPGLYLMLTYVYTRDIRCNMLLHMLYNSLAFLSLL